MQDAGRPPVAFGAVSKMATETSQRLRSGAVIAVAMGIMNLSTYGYTVLAAHTIGKEAYGAFSALMGALLVISVLSLGLQATGARRISAAPGQVIAIERVVLGVGLRSALVLGAVCLAIAPLLNAVLHLDSLPTALMVGVAAFPLTYMGAQAGVLQGERRWTPLALVYLSQGIGRVAFGLVLILIWPTELAAMAGVAFGCGAHAPTYPTARATRASTCSARSGTAARPCSPSSPCRTPTSWSPARPCRTQKRGSTQRA
jgi:O-antigen/teichoic acid export membrane protein